MQLNKNFNKLFFISLTALILVGCGGGGGSSTADSETSSPALDELVTFSGIYDVPSVTYNDLVMPSDAYIDFGRVGRLTSRVTVFDEQLNNEFLNGYKGKVFLSAGKYSVKIQNSDNGFITYYSPALTHPNKLEKFNNGEYSKLGSNYYILNMPSSGNIDFSQDYVSSRATIYDSNLNTEYFNAIAVGTVNLSSGTYIVKITNYFSNRSVVVYSTVLK